MIYLLPPFPLPSCAQDAVRLYQCVERLPLLVDALKGASAVAGPTTSASAHAPPRGARHAAKRSRAGGEEEEDQGMAGYGDGAPAMDEKSQGLLMRAFAEPLEVRRESADILMEHGTPDTVHSSRPFLGPPRSPRRQKLSEEFQNFRQLIQQTVDFTRIEEVRLAPTNAPGPFCNLIALLGRILPVQDDVYGCFVCTSLLCSINTSSILLSTRNSKNLPPSVINSSAR